MDSRPEGGTKVNQPVLLLRIIIMKIMSLPAPIVLDPDNRAACRSKGEVLAEGFQKASRQREVC